MSQQDSIQHNFGPISPGQVNDKLIAFYAKVYTSLINPEGAIAAPVGSFCFDIEHGVLYTKTSGGSTSTGWVAVGTGGGGGGTGGSEQVIQAGTNLGGHPAAEADFNWSTLPGFATRALINRFIITPTVLTGTFFDIEVRDSPTTGNLYLKANTIDCNVETYDVTAPWYFESTTTGSICIGIRNRSTGFRTFTLTLLRAEKFA